MFQKSGRPDFRTKKKFPSFKSTEVKQKLKHDLVSQLAESVVESDDESQAEQAGDDADFYSGEGDAAEEPIWRNRLNVDYPDQHNNYSPKQHVQSPEPPDNSRGSSRRS